VALSALISYLVRSYGRRLTLAGGQRVWSRQPGGFTAEAMSPWGTMCFFCTEVSGIGIADEAARVELRVARLRARLA
jgi:hypothetical protein